MAFQNYRVQAQASDVWTSRIFVGGSDPLQTAGEHAEFLQSGTTLTGSIIGAVIVSGGVALTTSSAITTNSNIINVLGSPYGVGDFIQVTTGVIITGGMWVSASGTTRATVVVYPTFGNGVGDSQGAPLGVVPVTAGSNTTANVLVRGLIALNAASSISGGTYVRAGSSTNPVNVEFAGSGNAILSVRGIAASTAASGTSSPIWVYLT